MPRSARAASSKAATVKKRANKRSVSRDPIYDITESPPEAKSADVELDESKLLSSSAPSTTDVTSDTGFTVSQPRARSRATSTIVPVATDSDDDATPKQKRASTKAGSTCPPVHHGVPGFEALEAVNGLYQKLQASQGLIDDLQAENRGLIEAARVYDTKMEALQAELKHEKDRCKKMQRALDQEKQGRKVDGEQNKRWISIIESLRAFQGPALGIMPLLDIVTGAPEIEYGPAAETLYQSFKQYDAERSQEAA